MSKLGKKNTLVFKSNLGSFPGTSVVWNSCLEDCNRWEFPMLDDIHSLIWALWILSEHLRLRALSNRYFSAADGKKTAERTLKTSGIKQGGLIPPHRPGGEGQHFFLDLMDIFPSRCSIEPDVKVLRCSDEAFTPVSTTTICVSPSLDSDLRSAASHNCRHLAF